MSLITFFADNGIEDQCEAPYVEAISRLQLSFAVLATAGLKRID